MPTYSNVKKSIAGHMWCLAKDTLGNFIVTMGDPDDPKSKLKHVFRKEEDLRSWVKNEVGYLVSENHVIDLTGLGLVSEYHTVDYVNTTVR